MCNTRQKSTKHTSPCVKLTAFKPLVRKFPTRREETLVADVDSGIDIDNGERIDIEYNGSFGGGYLHLH